MTDRAPSSLPFAKLERLTPRDLSRAAQRSVSYSRIVGVLRWALPAFVIAGLALLFLWPKMESAGLQEIIVQNVPNLMVENLNLTGLDPNNQAYSLTAKRALQTENLNNIIELEEPKADISLNDGSWLAGGATEGKFDQKAEKFWMGGKVEFIHDKGYRFLTSELSLDMKNSIVWSEKAVLFQGSFGEIRGDGLRVLEGGNVIIFEGPATARLYLLKEKSNGKPSVNDFKAQ